MKTSPKKKAPDVQTARGRLTGALKVAVAPPSEDDDVIDTSLPARGRPPLRSKRLETNKTTSSQSQSLHQSYIMKLFDRSVDLAKYNQNSALYPICRAWMQNQPRSSKIMNFKTKKYLSAKKRVALPNIVDDVKNGRIVDIQTMPAGNVKATIDRIPSPLPFQRETSRDNINLDYDLDDPVISFDDLLADLKFKGRMVRRKWQAHAKKYHEDKFPTSCNLLDEIFKK